MSTDRKPRPEFLALAESCGAVLTGKPDGSEAITVVFTIPAWQAFDTALAAAPAAPAAEPVGWVPVTERLPEKNTEVLICFAGQNTLCSTGQYTGHAKDVEGWCYPWENRAATDDGSDPVVTHWMPLPAAPGATPAQSREPLTDEQIEAAMNPCHDSDMGRHLRREFIAAFKRVYARLHGITKETTK